MPTIEELRKQVWYLYTEPTPPQKALFEKNLTDTTTLEIAGEAPIIYFSVFNTAHAEKAATIYHEFFSIANAHTDMAEGIEAVIRRYLEYKGYENPDLLYYALSVFITHHRFGRVLTIPNILVREPERVVPSNAGNTLENFDDEFGGASGNEGKLDWFREDPQQNEHHSHWHNVYPGNINKDRKGEMFLYMHQQMIARYDAERIAVGLGKVVPYTFSGPIEVGYNPGEFITNATAYSIREEGKTASGADLDDLLAGQNSLLSAIDAKSFQQQAGTATDDPAKIKVSDMLGHTLEPSNPVENRHPGFSAPGFNYHGGGHMIISDLSDTRVGVMSDPATAIRDAIFYQWHKHIDDLSFRLQEQYDSRNYADAPTSSFDHKTADAAGEPFSADIIFCLNKDVPGLSNPDFDGFSFGELAFGGDNWDKDYAAGQHTVTDSSGQSINFTTTGTLLTSMNKGTIRFVRNGVEEEHLYDYLNHEPFSYFLRIRNQGNARTLTCRLFMVPEGNDPATQKPYAENRRLWIELDKAIVDVKRNSKTVFFQFDRKSSVIRKPAQMDPANINTSYSPSEFNQVLQPSVSNIAQLFAFDELLRRTYHKNIKTAELDSDEQAVIAARTRLQAIPQANPAFQQQLDVYVRLITSFRNKLIAIIPYCDCGWPYNLFLPRGTKEGMKFKVMVMLTDAAYDVEEIGCCGSMSYCGAKDKYPDLRPMGYPFDRKFPAAGIVDTLNALPGVAFRTITIQCTNLDAFTG